MTVTKTHWVPVHEKGLSLITCLDGVWWDEAPVPPRGHECVPQTRGWLDNYYERCACGATRSACAPPAWDKPWRDRNSRSGASSAAAGSAAARLRGCL